MATWLFNWRRNGERSETMRRGQRRRGPRRGQRALTFRLPAPRLPLQRLAAGCCKLDAVATTTIPKKNPHKTPREQGSSKEWSPAPQQASQKPDSPRSGTNPNPERGMLQILNDPAEADQGPPLGPVCFSALLRFGRPCSGCSPAHPEDRGPGRGERERQVKREQGWISGVPTPSLTPLK